MKIDLSLDEMVRITREVVSERPNYIYVNESGETAGAVTNCTYVHHPDTDKQTPGCLLGHVFLKAGVPIDLLIENNDSDARTIMSCHEFNKLVSYDTSARNFAQKVQGSQDNGNTWGNALALALEEMGIDVDEVS